MTLPLHPGMMTSVTKASRLMRLTEPKTKTQRRALIGKSPRTKVSKLMNGTAEMHAERRAQPQRWPGVMDQGHGWSPVLLMKCMNRDSSRDCAWTPSHGQCQSHRALRPCWAHRRTTLQTFLCLRHRGNGLNPLRHRLRTSRYSLIRKRNGPRIVCGTRWLYGGAS